MGIVRFVVFGLVGVGLLLGSPAAADTLRQVFAANDISPSPNSPVDLDRSITSYAIENGDDLFAIAYYWANGEPLLPDTLQIAVLNKAARSWTSVSLPRARNGATSTDSSWFAGSVTAVAHTNDYLYIDTHKSPSAGTELVLTRQLVPVAALDGWILLVLPNGTALYEHSMVHFAPTHSAEMWMFEPRSGRDRLLYPTRPYQPLRRSYIEEVKQIYAGIPDSWFAEHNHHGDPERFDSGFMPPPVANANGTTVAFIVKFGNDDRGPWPTNTPVLDVLVVCGNLRAAARCTEQQLSEVRRTHASWSDAQILRDAAAGGR